MWPKWRRGTLAEFSVTPEDFGIRCQSEALKVTSAAESLSLIKDALGKRATPRGKAAADMIAR